MLPLFSHVIKCSHLTLKTSFILFYFENFMYEYHITFLNLIAQADSFYPAKFQQGYIKGNFCVMHLRAQF